MPKVNIREIDNTGSEQQTFVENIVLMPGLIINEYDKQGVKTGNTVDGLYEDSEEFINKVEQYISTYPQSETNTVKVPDYKNDLGFIMTIYLLKSGLPVQYFGAYNEGQDPTYTELSDLYTQYEDRGKYDIRFVTPGGLRSAEAFQAALECAGNRGDAVMLCSAPNTLKTTDAVDTWIQDNLGEICGTAIERKGTTWGTYTKETYGRYGAHFSPDFITSITVGDYKYENITLPGYFDYLACYSRYTQTFNNWYAMAGSIRGVTPLSKLVPLIKYGDADVDVLEPRDGGKYVEVEKEEVYENEKHIATNAICNIRPYGNIIWGNRTMHPLSAPENGSSTAIQLTASSFLNIRNLCIDIKKTLYRAARRYTFEPNSDVLWINFKSQITPLLEKMLSDQGIRGYQIVKLRTNKKAVLVARIKIIPIEAVEDFDLTVELADTIEVNE